MNKVRVVSPEILNVLKMDPEQRNIKRAVTAPRRPKTPK